MSGGEVGAPPVRSNVCGEVGAPPVRSNVCGEVGAPPVRSNMCTPLIAVSTAVRIKIRKTKRVRKAPVGEQLSNKTVPPAMRPQLHLPALHLFWALIASAVDDVGLNVLGCRALPMPGTMLLNVHGGE